METRKIALLGGAAIVLLGAASLAFVLWPEEPVTHAAAGPARSGALAAASAPGSQEVEPVPVLPAQVPPPRTPGPPASPPRIRERPLATSSVDWEQVPTAARLSDLGPALAAPVNAALQAARDEMDPCFDEDTRLQASRPAPVDGPDDRPTGPAVLVLRLESRAGGLDVIDTEVDSLGTSTRELVECARNVLKGWPIPAPDATPGTRYRLIHLLQ